MEPESYCDSPRPPAAPPARAGADADDGPRADCVLCGDPTEYPAEVAGSPLCPRCAWQQAQRGACSG